MSNRASLLRILLLSLVASSAFSMSAAPSSSADQSPSQSNNIQFNAEHSKTTQDIIYRLYRHHYQKMLLDDQLSARYLDHLLDTLDPNRYYFLSDDVAALQSYRYELDNQLADGDLTVPQQIMSLYFERAQQRLKTVIDWLESDNYPFDFNRDESLDLNNSERPWAGDNASLDDYWRKRIKLGVLNLMLSGETEKDARETIAKRFKNQLQRLNQQSSEDAYEIVMNALTELYDPHTSYMAPRTHESFNISMSLSLEGIGAVLQMDDNHTKVVRLIKAGPADKSGELQPADRIIAVGQGRNGDMVDVVGWRLDDVVDLIRGPKQSVVRLTVIPSDSVDSSDYKTIEITRGKVKLEEQSAQKAVVDLIDDQGELHKIGIIHIPAFYVDFEAYRRNDPNFKSTTRDVYKLLKELARENIDGLIIDLRDNGGGSLQEATTLTDLFIDQGPVVQIRQSNDRILRNHNSRLPAIYKGPLLVLTNRLSASASEIFAGAIQDYKRGLIVGTQSFGKGTVQSLIRVNQGQLKITESKFYRISGDSTQHRGIIPDIQYPQLINPDDVGESSYDNALPWDQIRAVKHRVYSETDNAVASLRARHNKRKLEDPDFTFLMRQAQRLAEANRDEQVSLNLAVRQAERAEAEQQALESENQRRTKKGLETFATIKQWRDDSKASKEKDQARYLDTSITLDDDPLLNEAGYILVDWLNMSRTKRMAQTQVH